MLSGHDGGVTYVQSRTDQCADSLVACLKSRVKIQHFDLLSDALVLPATWNGLKKE